MEDRKLEATAYHEAGHAVLVWLFTLGLGTVTIQPDKANSSAGRVDHHEYAEDTFNLFDLSPCSSAPGGFQMNITPTKTRDLTEDEQNWLNLRDRLYETDFQEAEVMVAAAGEVAQQKFSPKTLEPYHSEGDWNSVSQSLDGLASRQAKSVEVVRSELIARTKKLLDDPLVWRVVGAVAQALLDSETLSSEDVKQVIGQAVTGHGNQ